MRWLLWTDPTPRPGASNMAIDLGLMEVAAAGSLGIIRLYQWAPHCLSFGCHEPALRRYDRDAIEALGIDVVRRPTGGRAVWHAHELTYAVAAPDGALGTLREAYLRIHEALATAVRSMGAPASLAPAPAAATGLEAGACFSAAVGGEVTAHGAKLLGSAQLRRDGGMLQHGSLLLDGDQSLVARLGGHADPGVMTLRRALGRDVSWEDAALAIERDAVPHLAGRPTAGAADPAPFLAAAARHGQFTDPEWTWRR